MTRVETNPKADHIIGAAHAQVTLVEYGDFECPFCRQASPTVKILRAHFGDHMRFVYRHFPQGDAHPHAIQAAEAAEAAAAQGKFWEYHDLLFKNAPHLSLDNLIDYADHLGLDILVFRDDLEKHVYRERVEQQLASGIQMGVRATPTFFVNGELADVSYGYEGLQTTIQHAIDAA